MWPTRSARKPETCTFLIEFLPHKNATQSGGVSLERYLPGHEGLQFIEINTWADKSRGNNLSTSMNFCNGSYASGTQQKR